MKARSFNPVIIERNESNVSSFSSSNLRPKQSVGSSKSSFSKSSLKILSAGAMFFSVCNLQPLGRHLNKPLAGASLLRGTFIREKSPLNILVYETNSKDEVKSDTVNYNRTHSRGVHPKLNLLETAKPVAGVRVRQLGEGTVFSGFSSKWAMVKQELTAPYIADDEVVVVCDNRDVLLNLAPGNDWQTSISSFQEFIKSIDQDRQGAVLISAESGCCVGALTYAAPGDYFNADGTRNHRACHSGGEGCEWKWVERSKAGSKVFEEADVHAYARPWISFQNAIARERLSTQAKADGLDAEKITNVILNMGLIAGKKSDLIAFIDALSLKSYEDDQAVTTDYFYRFPNKIVLDYTGRAFGNNDWSNPDMNGCKYTQRASETGQLAHEDTGIRPLFLHYPGFSSKLEHKECMIRDASSLGHETKFN